MGSVPGGRSRFVGVDHCSDAMGTDRILARAVSVLGSSDSGDRTSPRDQTPLQTTFACHRPDRIMPISNQTLGYATGLSLLRLEAWTTST